MRHFNDAMVEMWHASQVRQDGVVTLADIFVFAARCRRMRSSGRSIRPMLTRIWYSLIQAVVPLLESYVLDIYGPLSGLTQAPRVLRTPRNHVRGGIDGETAWHVLQRAREVYRASPATVVAVKNDEKFLAAVHSCNGARYQLRTCVHSHRVPPLAKPR